jgi:hypothetical protein
MCGMSEALPGNSSQDSAFARIDKFVVIAAFDRASPMSLTWSDFQKLGTGLFLTNYENRGAE